MTDPPYGCGNDCDYSRFTGSLAPNNTFSPIAGDTEPFDPEPFLGYPKVCLWGFNHFASSLPVGSVLVWVKKRDAALGTHLSDAELAWMKGGRGVYVFRHEWSGFMRASERGEKTKHPTQKPVALFRWVFERMKLQPGDHVYDPFMGSGPVAWACHEAGLKYTGCEIVPEYYERAVERFNGLII